MYHWRPRDKSRWFNSSVKDSYLGDQAERIEWRSDLHPAKSRRLFAASLGPDFYWRNDHGASTGWLAGFGDRC